MKLLKLIIVAVAILAQMPMYPCTSAIISGKVTTSGRPLLWKHRDTGEEHNNVERIAASDSTFEYVALYNVSDTLCREAWMGMNAAGFAIMNTASYNLKNDTVTQMDKEGVLMTKALQLCTTVDDFAKLLTEMDKPMGVEANFGVVDAYGGGAYFETDNYSFTRYDLCDAENGVLIRTNYSKSGRANEGYGYIREQNAHDFIDKAAAAKAVCPQFLTEEVSRTFYHSLLGKDFTESGASWIVDQDFIPRRTSTATCVVESASCAGEEPVMWIGLGYPPASEIRAVKLGEPVADELRGSMPNGHSPLCDAAVAAKYAAFKINRGNGDKYIYLPVLYSKDGSGRAQIVRKKNLEYYRNKRKQLNLK